TRSDQTPVRACLDMRVQFVLDIVQTFDVHTFEGETMSATAVTWTTGWEPRAPRGGVRAGSAHQSVRSAGTAPASLRRTRRGRVVISLVALAAALGAALSTQSAAADAPVDALPVTTHTVTAGETLWEIA